MRAPPCENSATTFAVIPDVNLKIQPLPLHSPLRNSKFNPFEATSLKGSKLPPDQPQQLMAAIIELFSDMKMR
jgi:hypothetical protein